MCTGAGADQIAHPGEPAEGRIVGAVGAPEPGHLGEPPRDQARLGVVTETKAVGHPGGDRDDVLGRRAELDADQILVEVDPEIGPVEQLLDPSAERGVTGHDRGGRLALGDLLGVVGTREHGERRRRAEGLAPQLGQTAARWPGRAPWSATARRSRVSATRRRARPRLRRRGSESPPRPGRRRSAPRVVVGRNRDLIGDPDAR